MRRWDGLVDGYLRECEGRGLAEATVKTRCSELMRWGSWLKRRRPRPALEAVNAEMIVEYIRSRAHFRARATVACIVSELRGMGNYLVQAGAWTSNPLRWMRGPKIDPRMRRPRRIGREHLKALWNEAARNRWRSWPCCTARPYGGRRWSGWT
jgi:site-specific recombinase XerD